MATEGFTPEAVWFASENVTPAKAVSQLIFLGGHLCKLSPAFSRGNALWVTLATPSLVAHHREATVLTADRSASSSNLSDATVPVCRAVLAVRPPCWTT